MGLNSNRNLEIRYTQGLFKRGQHFKPISKVLNSTYIRLCFEYKVDVLYTGKCSTGVKLSCISFQSHCIHLHSTLDFLIKSNICYSKKWCWFIQSLWNKQNFIVENKRSLPFFFEFLIKSSILCSKKCWFIQNLWNKQNTRSKFPCLK